MRGRFVKCTTAAGDTSFFSMHDRMNDAGTAVLQLASIPTYLRYWRHERLLAVFLRTEGIQ